MNSLSACIDSDVSALPANSAAWISHFTDATYALADIAASSPITLSTISL